MSESRVLTAPRIAWQLRPAAPRPAPPSRAVTTDPRPPSAADERRDPGVTPMSKPAHARNERVLARRRDEPPPPALVLFDRWRRAVEARDRWTAADCLAELEALARRPFHRPVDTDDDVSSN